MLRDRISRLNAASLRISASLELDTVLSEVVESARALTDARYGGIVTVGDSGRDFDFVSSGLTADEHSQLLDWAEGPPRTRSCPLIPPPSPPTPTDHKAHRGGSACGPGSAR